MAGKSTISITFKLDGDSKSFKDLARDADGLKQVITSTLSEAQQLKGNVINFAALATGIDAAQRSFGQLQAGMKDLADAYAVQEMAETKLSTIMRQRMGATDKEIQSIKELASAQQEIGVIGDEVQLSGAQQIATFLNEKASLETLLPAMNNLLAQQKGLNATTQDAVTVGNLMGKVMQGQTSALTRVGITFTEAEEAVLKYGTEQERAAMLAQVITNNVGEMNAELAQTDSGKQQQLVNTLGDMKEELGAMVNGALPFVTIAAETTKALGAVTTLVTGLKTLTTTLYASAKAFVVSTAAVIKNKVATLAAAAAQRVVKAATVAWTAVQKVFNLVLTANPIGLIVAAIGALVGALVAAYKNCEGFRNIVDKVLGVITQLAIAIKDSLVKAFKWLIDKAKSAYEWLIKILGLGGKKAKVDVEVQTTNTTTSVNLDETKKKYENYKPSDSTTTKTAAPKITAPVYDDGATTLKAIGDNIEVLRGKLQTASIEEAAMINQQIAGWQAKADAIEQAGIAVKDNTPLWKEDANTLKEISDNIEILNEKLQNASKQEAATINQQIDAWNKKADAIKNVGKEAEKTSVSTGKALKDGWGGIKNIGSSIEGITDALKGNGNAWQLVVGIVDGFLGLYDGFQTVISIISRLTGVTNMLTAAKQGEATATAVATTAAVTGAAQEMAASASLAATKSAETTANVTAAASGAMAAHSSIPFVGIALGLAAVAAIIATMKSLPKFADGGVVSGPTLAMVGEYAGASGNPEVIAPLDKLRGMLAEPAGSIDFSKVQFEIKGRTLVGILNKENNLSKRS